MCLIVTVCLFDTVTTYKSSDGQLNLCKKMLNTDGDTNACKEIFGNDTHMKPE